MPFDGTLLDWPTVRIPPTSYTEALRKLSWALRQLPNWHHWDYAALRTKYYRYVLPADCRSAGCARSLAYALWNSDEWFSTNKHDANPVLFMGAGGYLPFARITPTMVADNIDRVLAGLEPIPYGEDV